MDIREELNRHVLETAELELELEMLNNLCAASVTEGVCMADVLSYESLGCTDITDELPVAFFSPERSETGVELAGESFFKSVVDKTAKLASAALDFVIRISKAMFKLLTGVQLGSSYKDTAKDYEQFRQRMQRSYGTLMHVLLLERPQIAKDINNLTLDLAGHVTMNADAMGDMVTKIESLKSKQGEGDYEKAVACVTEQMHKFIETNWHVDTFASISRLINKTERVKNSKTYDRRKPGSAKNITPAQDTANLISARYKALSEGDGDNFGINLQGFYNDAPDSTNVELSLDKLGTAFDKVTKATERLKEVRSLIDVNNFDHGSTFKDTLIAEHLITLNKVASPFYRSLSANISAYGKAAEVVRGIAKMTADMHTFLEQNKEYVK